MKNLWLPARALSPQGVPGNGYAFTIEKEVARPAGFVWHAPLSMVELFLCRTGQSIVIAGDALKYISSKDSESNP
ncbi:hypothetical protein DOT_4559 [Desulfosporosinus sp. OT]|nr:hypothetical protein DOT_4559 [Desulfosporosinus sp. OT]